MEVHLTDDQRAFIRQAIRDGRYGREEDAVGDALTLWEDRERQRAEILAVVDRSDASLAAGEGSVITQESVRALSDDVIRRGRARLEKARTDSTR